MKPDNTAIDTVEQSVTRVSTVAQRSCASAAAAAAVISIFMRGQTASLPLISMHKRCLPPHRDAIVRNMLVSHVIGHAL